MRVSAKTDYAVRAVVELAGASDGAPVKGERLAAAQEIPLRFLENILLQLRHAGIVESRRGADGGYKLARPPEEITLADVIRAIDGPLAGVSGQRPETLDFKGRSTREVSRGPSTLRGPSSGGGTRTHNLRLNRAPLCH